jgi:hypothetical protein
MSPKVKLKLRRYKDGPICIPCISIESPGFNPICFTRKTNVNGSYWILESNFTQDIEKKIGFGTWLDVLTLHTTAEQTEILDKIYIAGRRVYFLEDSLPAILNLK